MQGRKKSTLDGAEIAQRTVMKMEKNAQMTTLEETYKATKTSVFRLNETIRQLSLLDGSDDQVQMLLEKKARLEKTLEDIEKKIGHPADQGAPTR